MGNIVFDDAKVFSREFDTTVITGWWFGSLKDVSPVLEDNKESYKNYLNYLAPWIELDPFSFDNWILTISDAQFKVTIKEKVWNDRIDSNIDIFTDMDTEFRLIIQQRTNVPVNTENPNPIKIKKNGKDLKITIRRIL
jgi:hypothetical protein